MTNATETVFVVVNTTGENSRYLTHESIGGVYKTTGAAGLAAKEFGEYEYIENMERGDLLPDAVIYETKLHTTQVDSL